MALLVRRANQKKIFKGFHMNDEDSLSLVQFADDTVLISEGSWSDIWRIKSILRGFELISGLKINFWKSCLFGIGVDVASLSAVASFINCRTCKLPFTFLGISVGGNHRNMAFWNPVVNYFRLKLSRWNGEDDTY